MNSITPVVDTTYLNKPVQFYPLQYSVKEYRENSTRVAEKLLNSEEGLKGEEADAVNPLKHTYADGLYIREIFMPKGEIVISKIHKVAHPFFLIKGKMSVLSEDGERYLNAPYYCITPKGTKRMLYTHTDSIVVTVHRTFETELDKIEDEIIAKNYEELENEKMD